MQKFCRRTRTAILLLAIAVWTVDPQTPCNIYAMDGITSGMCSSGFYWLPARRRCVIHQSTHWMNYSDSENFCRAKYDGSIPKILNTEQQRELSAFLKDRSVAYWIGLRMDPDKGWLWNDGEPFNEEQNFHDFNGIFNIKHKGPERCVVALKRRWLFEDCGKKLRSVCETLPASNPPRVIRATCSVDLNRTVLKNNTTVSVRCEAYLGIVGEMKLALLSDTRKILFTPGKGENYTNVTNLEYRQCVTRINYTREIHLTSDMDGMALACSVFRNYSRVFCSGEPQYCSVIGRLRFHEHSDSNPTEVDSDDIFSILIDIMAAISVLLTISTLMFLLLIRSLCLQGQDDNEDQGVVFLDIEKFLRSVFETSTVTGDSGTSVDSTNVASTQTGTSSSAIS